MRLLLASIALLLFASTATRASASGPFLAHCDTDRGYEGLHIDLAVAGTLVDGAAAGTARLYFGDPSPTHDVPVTFHIAGDAAVYRGDGMQLSVDLGAQEVPNYYEVLASPSRLTATVFDQDFVDALVYCYFPDPNAPSAPNHPIH